MNDPWEGDCLNRKEDAEFLVKYLLRRNEAAVSSGEHGTSINVSAPWGAGKTFFVTRLARQLKSDGYNVATVDAWRDDHADDPIFAVMSAILKALGKAGSKSKFKTVLKNSAGKIAIRTGKGLLSRGAAFLIGQTNVDGIVSDVSNALVDASEQTANSYADAALKHFEDGQVAVDAFRESLKTQVADDQPLFVIIDELDRCRPTYAISLLERIKHLFDVPNVIFIVATNTDQLVHTIKAVYGTGFDAERYLLRFFERTYTFDEPDLTQFIQVRWDALEFPDSRLLELESWSHVSAIASISREMNLSPRDAGQILAITRSIIDVSDDRIKIPLLFIYPLVGAYHLRYKDAFAAALSETNQNKIEEEYKKIFTAKPLKLYPIRDPFAENPNRNHEISLNGIMDIFRTIIRRGLSEYIDEDQPLHRYAERYRRLEYDQIWHNNPSQRPVPTVLSSLGATIKKANRFGPRSNKTA